MKKQYILLWISSAVVFGLLVFGKKNQPFGAAHTYIAYKSEYAPPHPPGGAKNALQIMSLATYATQASTQARLISI